MDKEEKVAAEKEKMRRIAVAATAAGVLLFVFLFIVLIIQFVQMGVRNGEARELEEGIRTQQEIIDKNEKVLDDYLYGEGLYYRALMQGWKTR